MRPTAAAFSLYSTVRGKKSWPSLTFVAETAVTMMTVSPMVDEGSAVGEFGEFACFDVKVAVAQAGSKGFVVGAHSWMDSVGRYKA